MIKTTPFQPNNFDLIRLLAAMQVVVSHAKGHLHIESTWLETAWNVLSHVPGVPIFFFISGFLISLSYERSPSLKSYCWNRALRIFPALWVCLAVSILMVWSSGFEIKASYQGLCAWVLSQLTVFQFYNPSFLREYGVGVLNGSLWTIPVEIQFYLLTPALYLILNRIKSKKIRNVSLGLMILIFVAVNAVCFSESKIVTDSFSLKLFMVSFAPYFYMFLIGVASQKNWDRIKPYFCKKFIFWLLAYIIVATVSESFGFRATGNEIGPVSFLFLAAL